MNNFYNTNIVDHEEEDENSAYNRYKRLRTAKYLISSLLAFTGIVILTSQLWPLAQSYIQGWYLESQEKAIQDPTPQQELYPDETDLPYYDPGVSYFQNLIEHIGGPAVAGISTTNPGSSPQEVFIDTAYNQPMRLTIESAGIIDVNITSNVDSLDEETYNAALKNGLAHFLGTPLPGDGGNSFIYGHSAVESFFSRHPDYAETIFSRLQDVDIADTITIKKDDKIFTYVVQKKKIIEPNDFDVIEGTTNKETVTLMTCWPLGIGSKRLIVIAERIDG